MENLDQSVVALEQLALHYTPLVIGFVLVGLGGVVLSAIARRVTRWAVSRTGLDVLSERVGVPKMLYAIGIKQNISDVLGQLVWWAGLLVTLNALAGMLGLQGVADGLAALIAWLPNLFTGALVALAGVYAAEVVQSMVSRVASNRGDIETADFLGRGAYFLVLAICLTMAADQVGLPTHLVDSILLLSVAAVGFGVALAFALAARNPFSHLVARHYLQRMYRPGDRIEQGDVSGELVRFGAVSAVLITDKGELVVPCSQLLDGTVRLIRKAD